MIKEVVTPTETVYKCILTKEQFEDYFKFDSAEKCNLMTEFKEAKEFLTIGENEISIEKVSQEKIYAYADNNNDVFIIHRSNVASEYISICLDGNYDLGLGDNFESLKEIIEKLYKHTNFTVFQFDTQKEFFEWGLNQCQQ